MPHNHNRKQLNLFGKPQSKQTTKQQHLAWQYAANQNEIELLGQEAREELDFDKPEQELSAEEMECEIEEMDLDLSETREQELEDEWRELENELAVYDPDKAPSHEEIMEVEEKINQLNNKDEDELAEALDQYRLMQEQESAKIVEDYQKSQLPVSLEHDLNEDMPLQKDFRATRNIRFFADDACVTERNKTHEITISRTSYKMN